MFEFYLLLTTSFSRFRYDADARIKMLVFTRKNRTHDTSALLLLLVAGVRSYLLEDHSSDKGCAALHILLPHCCRRRSRVSVSHKLL